jgi:hypothetical protein
MPDVRRRDFALCNEACKRIVNKYPDTVTPSELSGEERVVVVVWTVRGIVENGGFRYLFESALPGDPKFEHTLAAFETLGCSGALLALRRALDLFPEGEMPTDDRLRIEEYERQPEEVRDAIDVQFWEALDDITRKLADFIRSRVGAVR